MPRPICTTCRVELKCVKNGFVVEHEPSGIQNHCDLYECPACGVKIAIGFGGDQLDKPEKPGCTYLRFLEEVPSLTEMARMRE